jgi:hypothetical protein
MKNFVPLFISAWLLAGCTTTTSYHPAPDVVAGASSADDYPIPVYTEDNDAPRPGKQIGEISIGHTSVTVVGGSIDAEMKKVMDLAHKKGADFVQIVNVDKPGFDTANYGVRADLMRYADNWETVPMSENDLAAYLQQHRKTLDPIEGIWSGGWPNRVGIIKDSSKPGRDFIAFTLNSDSPAWRKGYKKMDITIAAPGSYAIKYYRNDFAFSQTVVALDHNREFDFMMHTENQTFVVTYRKLGAPILVH